MMILLLATTFTGLSLNTSDPQVMIWGPGVTQSLQERVRSADPQLAEAVAALRRHADRAMDVGPLSVIHKTFVPPSGDLHDYSTIGRYWWPNPDTPNGLPWVRRDGETNPQYFDRDFGDTQRFVDLWRSVTVLARAYYFTGEQAYAKKAAELLRVWFIDPETRMNPHARYAARFPGHWDGKSWGIHGTRQLTLIADAAGLLTNTPHWTNADQAAMRRWLDAYLEWMLTSENGIEEGNTTNNHAVAYDWMVMRLAVFVGRRDLAQQVAEAFKTRRIAAQIEPDGSMPHELKRAKPWRYTGYALEYLFASANLARQLDVDLWHHQTEDGRGIRRALDYLVRQIEPDPEGPLQEALLKEVDVKRIGPLLGIAARVYDEPDYTRLMERMGWDDTLSLIAVSPTAHTMDLD